MNTICIRRIKKKPLAYNITKRWIAISKMRPIFSDKKNKFEIALPSTNNRILRSHMFWASPVGSMVSILSRIQGKHAVKKYFSPAKTLGNLGFENLKKERSRLGNINKTQISPNVAATFTKISSSPSVPCGQNQLGTMVTQWKHVAYTVCINRGKGMEREERQWMTTLDE